MNATATAMPLGWGYSDEESRRPSRALFDRSDTPGYGYFSPRRSVQTRRVSDKQTSESSRYQVSIETTGPLATNTAFELPTGWLTPEIEAQLKKYAALERGWDGYNGDPIMPSSIEGTRAFLRSLPASFPKPDLSPGADGVISIIWQMGDVYLDIGFSDATHYSFYGEAGDTSCDRAEQEGDYNEDQELRLFIGKLAGG